MADLTDQPTDIPAESAAAVPPGTEPADTTSVAGEGRPIGSTRVAHLICLLVLMLAALVTLGPGIDRMPLTDKDEGLYVQTTRQMLESGNWIDLRFQEQPRYKKPIGIYWMQAAVAEVTGYGAQAPIWVYRLPSLIGAVLVVLFTYGIGATLAGWRAGLIGGLLVLSTLSLTIEAHIAKTDAMLTATVLACELALARIWIDGDRQRKFGRNALFWTALGVGVLIKGPITPLIAGVSLIGLSLSDRSTALWRSLSPLRGLVWLAVLVLPWLVAIGWISGGAFFTEAVGKDLMGKVAGGQEGHGAPPGTYVAAAIGLFWPMVALVPMAIGSIWRQRREAAQRFLLIWPVPVWLLFELVPTKLPNYILPLMPPVALLVALALAGGGLPATDKLARRLQVYLAVGAVLLGLGLNAGFVYVAGHLDAIGLGVGVVAGITGIVAWKLLAANRLWSGLAAMVATSALVYGLAFARLLPAADDIWLSREIGAVQAELKPCAEPVNIVTGYGAPSVVFALGTRTALVPADGAADRFAAASCAVAFIEVGQSGTFLARLAEVAPDQPTPVPVRMVEGRNLDGFKLRSLQVFIKPQ